ncbi:MAG: long-chain-fatty-acid--CoA ligase [Hyphomicrobiales bacterium]|nr:long-chain-fatty-acid--CoA ligase [Hyphomicrobiales bacterium]MCP5374020.1 long-chain-fatty-acid--CoA ligase [Hyphomicrobiales bacterium]
MLGLMQDGQLLLSTLPTYAARNHGTAEIVSNTVEGGLHRYTWADAEKRMCRLAHALRRLKVDVGDRIATLAWNGYRHVELYFAVPGIGAVCHTINPRLFPQQIAYIVNHAQDKVVFTELTFVPLLEALADHLGCVEAIVIMTDAGHMPQTALSDRFNVLCYEDILAAEKDTIDWPRFDENTASSLCYTSGTTGNPKGVLYSHRSTILHSLGGNQPDLFGAGARDCIMPVVPMFHANAWGLVYIVPMTGAKMVLPGMGMDGETLQRLMEEEGVTISAGVPTIWMGLLQYLRQSGKRLDNVERFVIGGSACPRVIIEEFDNTYGIRTDHAWGMTETSPIGSYNSPKPNWAGLDKAEVHTRQLKQGRGLYGIEMKIVDGEGNDLPWDGEAFGALLVRGPWVVREYYRSEDGPAVDADGWFNTGDVANIDPDGFMQIVDRTKDVIKSGGEWISSIELENVAVGHPAIVEAAVIACPHPKWDERPLLICVAAEGASVTREDMLAHFEGKIAKWWMPDDVVFVDELPHTATGKLSKLELREKFAEYKLPTA